jgi:ankyrin repeat protein
VNAKNEDGYTALHEAVSFDDVSIVECLLAANASVSIRNDDGQTPLDLAKLLGKEGIINRLMS